MTSALSTLDYVIIAVYVVFALGVGSLFMKQASEGIHSFFVGDRRLPWWIAGTSIVATTFAADTPLAVAGIVANDGISGNWIWWSWAIAHLTATFFFARLWRRSGVITDAEISEVRYSGKAAAGLRAFKAVYFGIFINCLTMAWVIAAMVKISSAFFPDVPPSTVIAVCIAVSVAYTTLGGFRGVVITDVIQFTLGMAGAIALAVYALKPVGEIGALPDDGNPEGAGLLGALAKVTSEAGGEVSHVLEFLPGAEHPSIPPLYFAVLLFAGWWRYAEGNGYLVQRLAASRDEGHAQGASLWFSVAHNALRPWPWILVGLVGLVVFPKLPGEAPAGLASPDATGRVVRMEPAELDVGGTSTVAFHGARAGCVADLGGQAVTLVAGDGATTRATFAPFDEGGIRDLVLRCPDAPPTTISGVRLGLKDRELAYPIMMRLALPAGLLGLVIASLLAAFMSTIDTHTNWGASYLVNDVYKRFIKKDASEPHYVLVSRLCIVLMAVLAGISATFIGSIAEVWRFLIALGAGLGSVTAARWYWHRVTPFAEIAAMVTTTALAVGLELFCTKTLFGRENGLYVVEVAAWAKILIIAGGSLATWIPVALLGPRNDPETLRRFAATVRPPGPGWAGVRDNDVETDSLGPPTLHFLAGLVVVFATLFGLGEVLLGRPTVGVLELAAAALCLAYIIRAGRGQRIETLGPAAASGASSSSRAVGPASQVSVDEDAP